MLIRFFIIPFLLIGCGASEYSNENTKMKKFQFAATPQKVTKSEKAYDEYDNLTLEVLYNSKGQVVSKHQFTEFNYEMREEFKYSNTGQLTEHKSFQKGYFDDELKIHTTRTYTYDAQGQLVSKLVKDPFNGNGVTYTYTYSGGNLVKIESDETNKVVIEYDWAANKIKFLFLNGLGQVNYQYDYETFGSLEAYLNEDMSYFFDYMKYPMISVERKYVASGGGARTKFKCFSGDSNICIGEEYDIASGNKNTQYQYEFYEGSAPDFWLPIFYYQERKNGSNSRASYAVRVTYDNNLRVQEKSVKNEYLYDSYFDISEIVQEFIYAKNGTLEKVKEKEKQTYQLNFRETGYTLYEYY